MRTLRLATALTAVLLLALPALAQAGSIKHRGKITGVPGTVVKFAVKKQGGELKSIANMTFTDVPVICEDDRDGDITVELPRFPVSGKEFTRKGKIEGDAINDGFLRVSGKFSDAGRRASGQIRISFKSDRGAGCATNDVAWKTRKR
jgi:hypothetical protein